MPRPSFRRLAERLAATCGPLETTVVASIHLDRREMLRLLRNPNGPALAALARALLVEALEMMEEAADTTSIDLANRIEDALLVLPDFNLADDCEHL